MNIQSYIKQDLILLPHTHTPGVTTAHTISTSPSLFNIIEEEDWHYYLFAPYQSIALPTKFSKMKIGKKEETAQIIMQKHDSTKDTFRHSGLDRNSPITETSYYAAVQSTIPHLNHHIDIIFIPHSMKSIYISKTLLIAIVEKTAKKIRGIRVLYTDPMPSALAQIILAAHEIYNRMTDPIKRQIELIAPAHFTLNLKKRAASLVDLAHAEIAPSTFNTSIDFIGIITPICIQHLRSIETICDKTVEEATKIIPPGDDRETYISAMISALTAIINRNTGLVVTTRYICPIVPDHLTLEIKASVRIVKLLIAKYDEDHIAKKPRISRLPRQ